MYGRTVPLGNAKCRHDGLAHRAQLRNLRCVRDMPPVKQRHHRHALPPRARAGARARPSRLETRLLQCPVVTSMCDSTTMARSYLLTTPTGVDRPSSCTQVQLALALYTRLQGCTELTCLGCHLNPVIQTCPCLGRSYLMNFI